MPNGPKQIFCHHCGAFGHLRPHYSKFQALKRIKRKEKPEFLESCAKKEESELNKNGKLLKHMINALTSLSICISDSHSFKPHLTSHETLTPDTYSIWVRKGSYD